MKSIQELRERRAAKAQEARKILDDNTGDKWTPRHGEQVDTLYAEIEAIDGQIRRLEKAVELENENKLDVIKPGEIDPKSPKALFNKWVRQGDQALSAADWQVIRNVMSTTTGSEGGFTVPAEISSTLYDAMKAFGAMRTLAEVFRTADGRPLSFPTSDGTSEVGELIAQNVTATGLDPTFGTVALDVYKYSSKIVAAPIELLQDTTIDMESFIRKRLGQRLGRINNQHFTTGTGTAQPRGIVTGSTVGRVGATGQTTTIIYDDLVDLVHSVDPAYRTSRSAFMTSDTLMRVLRKLKDTQNRPLWLPSWEAGISRGVGSQNGGYNSDDSVAPFDLLMGYPIYVNNDMAAPAANARSLVFGDFSYYKVRDALEVQMFRFADSNYVRLGQIGFLAWSRSGGNLVDTNAVKHYAHSAT